jgi:uncharacterized protein YlzI (FlbEa/FlbD family)
MSLTTMIQLHRIGHTQEPLALNPALVVSIEAHPDTTILLATGTRLVVAEDADRVVELINAWHAAVAAAAMRAHVEATRGPDDLPPDAPIPLRRQ